MPEDCKLFLFRQRTNDISIQDNPDEIPYSPCNSLETLIIFIKIRKLEFIRFIGGKIANWF